MSPLTADRILIGTCEIAAGNQDLSGRTEQQASLLETTSSVARIDDTLRRGNEPAKEVPR